MVKEQAIAKFDLGTPNAAHPVCSSQAQPVFLKHVACLLLSQKIRLTHSELVLADIPFQLFMRLGKANAKFRDFSHQHELGN